MKIYNCFPFFNELDLLEIRLKSLYDIVDYFIITESKVSFQGKPKPLYYLENEDRFKKFHHKIIHNIVSDSPITDNCWDIERHQRNYSMVSLLNCADDDIIISDDTDEISNPVILIDVIKNKYKPNHLVVFKDQEYCCYYLDAVIENIPWPGTRLTNYGHLKNYTIDLIRNESDLYWQEHRNDVINIYKKDYNKPIGWHYSWLGGEENMKLKLSSFGHKEYNIDYIKNSLKAKSESLKDIIERPGFDAIKIKLTKDNCSDYLYNNLNKYKHLLCNQENII